MSKREIDIMFSGGIGTAETPAAVFEQLNIRDQKIQTVLEAASENVLAGTGDIVWCIGKAFNEHGIELDAIDQQTVFETLDGWTRTLRRHRLFATLKDVKINFYSHFHDSFKALHPKSTFHDPVSYRRVTEISKNAKITINDTINLMDSALFRFYYAIHLNNRDPHNGAKIQAVLADTAKCEAMVAAAQHHYAQHHTWASRMPAVLESLRKD